MTKAIIFDCFGVLVTEGWNAFRDTYFASEPQRHQSANLRHAADQGVISNEAFEQQIAALAGVSPAVVQSYIRNNVPNQSLLDYIQHELQPRFRLGMLSNAAANWLEEFFTPEQRQLFTAIVLSYEIKAAKPDPRAYEAICQRLGVAPEECLFVDDTERFCTTARSLGMQVVWYKDFLQCKAEIQKIMG